MATKIKYKDTGLIFEDKNDIKSIVIDGNSNVGIGVTDPDEKLDLLGNMRLSNYSNIWRQKDADYDAYFLAQEQYISRYADTNLPYTSTGPVLAETHKIIFGYDLNTKSTSGGSYYPCLLYTSPSPRD